MTMLHRIESARVQYCVATGNYPTEVWLGQNDFRLLDHEIVASGTLNHHSITTLHDSIQIFGLTVRVAKAPDCLRIGSTIDFTSKTDVPKLKLVQD